MKTIYLNLKVVLSHNASAKFVMLKTLGGGPNTLKFLSDLQSVCEAAVSTLSS